MGSPFGDRAAGARLERIQASPRFVDGAFRNTVPRTPVMKGGRALGTMGEFFFGGQRRTPPGPLPSEDPRAAWQRPAETGLRATWLGHSTVLVEIDGLRVLTDPVWGERASPSRFAGPKRFQPVPVAVAALPPLDAVIVSHDHYDHLDYPTILALAASDVPFYTSLGVGRAPAALGRRARAHHRARLVGDGDAAAGGAADHRRAVAALLRARPATATRPCGRRSRCAADATRSSSAATPA